MQKSTLHGITRITRLHLYMISHFKINKAFKKSKLSFKASRKAGEGREMSLLNKSNICLSTSLNYQKKTTPEKQYQLSKCILQTFHSMLRYKSL